MSFSSGYTPIPNIVFDFWIKKLGKTSLIILIILIKQLKNDECVSISLSKLREISNFDQGTIINGIRELESKGAVEKILPENSGGTNKYKIKI